MIHRRYLSVVFATLLALSVLVISLLWLSNFACAQGSTLYVTSGGDCGGMNPCYATIQFAVDAASDGDTIKVAQGTYTGAGLEVIYINKAINSIIRISYLRKVISYIKTGKKLLIVLLCSLKLHVQHSNSSRGVKVSFRKFLAANRSLVK